MVARSSNIDMANRLLARLYPFKTYCAGSVIPPGYDFYCRILHPALSDGGQQVTWSAIAEWAGRVYHPAMQF